MGLTSNTGLLATVPQKPAIIKQKSSIDLRCEVTPAPFMLRPYAGLFNPFSHGCSVLCNHPADTEAKEFVKRAKDNWVLDGKPHYLNEDLSKIQDGDKEKIRTPHDIVTEDMFRRYAETDSRPHTPAPTLASGKSRGSRRCLTPDQPHKTAIVLDLRRSHSQETLYYHGYTTSEMTGGPNTSPTNERSTLPSLNLSDGAHARLLKGQCEQLPPLASPLVLTKRIIKEPASVRTAKKGQCEQLPPLASPLVLTKRIIKEPASVRAAKKNPSKVGLLPSTTLTRLLKGSREAAEGAIQAAASAGLSASPDQEDHQGTCWPELLRRRNKKGKEKSFFVTGDNLNTVKPRRIKRKPLKLPPIIPPSPCDCNLLHLTKIVISYAPKSRKRGASNIVLSMTAWGTTGQRKRMKLPSVKHARKIIKREPLIYDSDEFFKKLENQLKALNLGPKPVKAKKSETPASQRSKADKEAAEANVDDTFDEGANGEARRRGKRRKKGRNGAGGSDRLTSAGLAAQAQQDPETQVAGIGTDSQNPSSRGSIAASADDDVIILPVIKPAARSNDSFLDDDILKYLHREVDEEAIETEFDVKRRYVLEEALRTRPDRPHGAEMQTLLKELKVAAVSLGDWLHIPRVFSRRSAQFSLPIDSNSLETLTPMNYAARFVTLKKSKQLLYLTVMRKFRDRGYRMPIKDVEEGLILMMGGILTAEQAARFKTVMEFDSYVEEDSIPDEIKLTLIKKSVDDAGDTEESVENTLNYRTWCGLCAVCERMYGRFPPRDKDPPDGMELSDFTMVETKLAVLKVHRGLVEILNTIRER